MSTITLQKNKLSLSTKQEHHNLYSHLNERPKLGPKSMLGVELVSTWYNVHCMSCKLFSKRCQNSTYCSSTTQGQQYCRFRSDWAYLCLYSDSRSSFLNCLNQSHGGMWQFQQKYKKITYDLAHTQSMTGQDNHFTSISIHAPSSLNSQIASQANDS